MANDVTINVKANTSQAQSQMSALNKSFVGINSAIEIGQKAAQALGQAYDFLAGDTMKYAAQVRQMMRVSGQNAEMTSRMIQLTDDFAISNETLAQAMKGATAKGIAFTTENLAKMSDEYRKLTPGLEQARFAAETFGARAGPEMQKLLEKGSKAIRDQSAAISDNMIMTQANLDQAEALRIAEDDLNDSLQGVKYTIGNELIPILVKAADAFQLLVTWNERLNKLIEQQEKTIINTKVPYDQYLTQMTEMAKQAGIIVVAEKGVNKQYRLTAAGSVEVTDAIDIMTRAEYAAITGTDGINRALSNTTTEMRFIQTYGPGAAGAFRDLEDAASDVKGEMDTLNGLLADYNEQMFFNIATQGMDEKSKILVADAMGLIDEKTRVAIVKSQELRQEFQDTGDLQAFAGHLRTAAEYLGGLNSKDIHIRTFFETYNNGVYTGNPVGTLTTPTPIYVDPYGQTSIPIPPPLPGKAAGGPVNRGQSYIVGERGPELFSPSMSGNIIPNNQINNSWGGVNINIPGAGSPQATANAVANRLAKYGKQYQG